MDFEGTTTDAPELATPAPQGAPAVTDDEQPIDLDAPSQEDAQEEDAQPDAENEGEDAESAENQDEPDEAEADVIDFTAEDGKTYKVPKELEGHLLRQADYTRKTQAVAEKDREADTKLAQASRNLSMSEEVIEARAYKLNLEQQLAQYQSVDWQQLEAEDPLGATSHWRQYQQLRDAYGNVASFLDQKQSEWTAQAEQETAIRLQETAAFAQREIPGWSPEMDGKITEFAEKQLGFTRDMLKQAYNPQVYRTLFYAMRGFASLQKQATAPKPAAPSAKPLRKVSGSGSVPVSKSPEDMSPAEYAAWRKTPEGRSY